MIRCNLLALLASHAAASAGLLMPGARSAAANGCAHTDVFRAVRRFEESGGESYGLALDATLEMLDVPRSDPGRKRLWRNVPGAGVISDRRVLRMRIVRESAVRATVDAKTRVTVVGYDRTGDLGPSEKPRTMSDRIELAATGGDWLIVSVARRIR